MKRWSNSITTTIAFTVIVAIGLGFSLQEAVRQGMLYAGLGPKPEVQQRLNRVFGPLPSTFAALVDVLEVTPASERSKALGAVHLPDVEFRLLDAPLPGVINRGDVTTEALRHKIESVLQQPWSVIVSTGAHSPESATSSGSETGTIVEAELSDGQWLLAKTAIDAPLPWPNPAVAEFSRETLALSLIASAVLGVAVSFMASRRLVRPLSELAAAVEQLGGSGDALPLKPQGPREFKGTIQAFNRMQDRLRRFNEDRTRMIAAMSHDLKTPTARLQLRLESVGDLELRQKMQQDVDRMIGLIESILSFSRDDTKREPRVLTDLSALVEGVCEDAADAGQAVTFSGPRAINISCRPAALRRAISNIIDNAVKYGKTAVVKLATEARQVTITVEDEGPGIPRDMRERVFEPFYRMESSRNRDTGGVGLGLSVARSTIWEHGGDISLANRRGGGLSVRLELSAANY